MHHLTLSCSSAAQTRRPLLQRLSWLSARLLPVLCLLVLMGGCTRDPGTPGPGSPDVPAAPSPGPTTSASPTPSPRRSAPARPRPYVTQGPGPSSTATPAGRSTTSSSRSPATEGTLTRAAQWADGVTVKVVSTKVGKTTGVGAGTEVGRPIVTFTMRLSNESSATINASEVVVGATYGTTPKETAQPVYDDSVRDFSGQLKPNHTATARYTFEIRSPKTARVVLTVDLDAAHDVATLRGSVQ